MIRALIIFLLSGLIAVLPPYKNALTLTKIKKIFFLIFFGLFWGILDSERPSIEVEGVASA